MHSPNSPPSLRLSRHVRNSVTQKIANQIVCLTEERFGVKKWLSRKLGKLTTKTDILKMNGLTNTCSLLCLLCVETVALIKSGNIKRHYESKHRSFEEKAFPEVRAWKISELRAQYERSTRVFTH